MRKLLNVLYVTTPDAYIAKDGENIVIRVAEEERFRIPVHNLEGVVCFGYQGASPRLMHHCAKNGVALSFHNEYGRFLARVEGPVHGNVLLRRTQYRYADDDNKSLEIAKSFIIGKVSNSRTVILRAVRDHPEKVNIRRLEDAADSLAGALRKIPKCGCMDTLRGIEGDATHTYFSVFDELILENTECFRFGGRNRRPPMDCMNALLSYIYVILSYDIQSALESVGLDPAVGFMHSDRPGRASLALDMMEELRPYLADRMALTLVNRKQADQDCFFIKETGAVLIKEQTRKDILAAWQERKQEEITHPFVNEKIPVGLIAYVQAMLLARYLRGDIDGYPPFLLR